MSSAPLASANELVAAVREAYNAPDPEAVYLGTGLATRTNVATGQLPMDALAMLLVAERARKRFGAAGILHLVADEHALINGFAREAEVMRAAESVVAQLRHVAPLLGLRGYEIVRASELRDTLHCELHQSALDRCSDPYAAREAADVEWARRRHGATIKVGWTMQPRLDMPPGGHDERYFDQVYRELFGDRVTAIYTHAGRRVDQHPGASPYAHQPGERRLTLSSTAAEVIEICASTSMRRHLRPLIRELQQELNQERVDDLREATAAVLRALDPLPLLNPSPTER